MCDGVQGGGFLFFRINGNARIQPKSHHCDERWSTSVMRSIRQLFVVSGLAFVVFLSPIAGAQNANLPDTAPIANIGAGSTVAVNADILLPANQSNIYFQNGAVTTWEQIDKKAPSCRLSTVESPVVRRLAPGRKLVITGTLQNNGSVFFYGDVLQFEEDATVSELQCSPGHKGPMSIGELKQVFGSMLSLIQAMPVVG
jgi:hypothetical protein